MPFTPFHMGPGILIKSLMHGSFSLMVFGWTQIVMDIQPLIVLLTGEGHLHGFSHTYVGASLLAIFSALSGKYLSEFALHLLLLARRYSDRLESGRAKADTLGTRSIAPVKISWLVALISAFIGSFSHVFLDSIIHLDVQPYFPFALNNHVYQMIPADTLYKLCLYSGVLGGLIYYTVQWLQSKPRRH